MVRAPRECGDEYLESRKMARMTDAEYVQAGHYAITKLAMNPHVTASQFSAEYLGRLIGETVYQERVAAAHNALGFLNSTQR